MFRLNYFLHHHPLVVVLIGSVLIFVSVLTPRRVNYWLLILYFLIVLPCTQTMDSASVTKFLYIPGFILEFINQYTILHYLY